MKRLAACAILCVACEGGGADRAAVVTRDSAGVRITESATPAWSEGAGWRITEEPTLRIGAVEGSPEYQFFRVRAVARLSDGRIVVLNEGSEDVRLYGADGRHLATFGGPGDGPGEFRSPYSLWVLPGDTMLVADFVRLSFFDGDGRFIRTEPLGDRIPNLRLSGGRFAYLGFASIEGGTALGQSRPLMALVRIAPDGSRDTLATMPGNDTYRIMRNRGVSSWEPPFGLHRYIVARSDSFYTGDGSAFEVTVLDTAGRVARIMRRPDLDVAVTGERVDEWRASQLALSPTEARVTALNTILREATVPAHQPEWNGLTLDVPGDVWVHHYALGRDTPSTWTVFDPAGRWLGEVRMPASFGVREIGADYLLGVRTDSLGVEYVERYGLLKR